MLTNREAAVAFWLVVAAAFALRDAKLRSSFGSVLKQLLGPRILLPLLSVLAWVAAEVAVGRTLGWWTSSLVKDTLLWTGTSAVAMFLAFMKAAKQPRYFRQAALAAVGLPVVVEVVTSEYATWFPLELCFVLVMTVMAGVAAYAAHRPEHVAARKLAEWVLVLGGVWALGLTAYSIAVDWGTIDKGDLLRHLALPMWLTIGLLPALYGLALYASYEVVFKRMDWRAAGRRGAGRASWKAKAMLSLWFNVRAHDLHRFSGRWSLELADASTFRSARDVLARFRSEQQRSPTSSQR